MCCLRIHEAVRPRRVKPTEFRHIEVHDDHVKPLILQRIERLLAITDDSDLVTGALQYPDDNTLVDRVVLRHQNLVTAPISVTGSVVIAERNDTFLAPLDRSSGMNRVEQKPLLERHFQHRRKTARKRLGAANLRYSRCAQHRRGYPLAAVVAEPCQNSARLGLSIFADENQVVRMPERLRLGETRGSRFDACGASGTCPPGSEILLQRMQLRFGKAEQHDSDVV